MSKKTCNATPNRIVINLRWNLPRIFYQLHNINYSLPLCFPPSFFLAKLTPVSHQKFFGVNFLPQENRKKPDFIFLSLQIAEQPLLGNGGAAGAGAAGAKVKKAH